MYYIYVYIDPFTQIPFYIGKGQGRRAREHLFNEQVEPKNRTRFKNKVEKLKREGSPPIIKYLVEGMVDEDQAYLLERKYIQLYGRKGYDPFGVLLNICLDSRPPNHKGRTYKEIYGDKAQEQVEKRRLLQIERGGFGPKCQSEETRKKISEAGRRRKGQSTEKQREHARRMGLANKGRKKPNP